MRCIALALLLSLGSSTALAENNPAPKPKELTIVVVSDTGTGAAIVRCPDLPPRPFNFQDVPADEVGKALLDENAVKAAWDTKFGKEKPRKDFHSATDQAFIEAGKCTGGALYIVLYTMKKEPP